jgi:hypothetical protein
MAARPQSRWTRTRRPLVRLLAAASIGVCAIAVALPCRANEQQAFELAKSRFDTGDYKEAHGRLASLLNPSLPPCDKGVAGAPDDCRLTDTDLIERARALDAAALLALKREAEADARIEAILRQNPTYTPNPALFPQEVLDRFILVRTRIQPELAKQIEKRDQEERARRIAQQKLHEAEQRWIDEIQKMAGEERVIERHSRLIALLPFGLGQFQNGDTALGVVFAVSEALLGAGSLVSYGVFFNYATTNPYQRGPEGEALVPGEPERSIQIAATVNRVLFSAWAGVSAIGIVQAQIAFVPEKVTPRKRTVPPRPKATISVLPGGVGVGMKWSF